MSTCEELANKEGKWDNCKTPDCPNKACLTIRSKYCYPCSFGLPLDFNKCIFCGSLATERIDEGDTFMFEFVCHVCKREFLLPVQHQLKINHGPIRK